MSHRQSGKDEKPITFARRWKWTILFSLVALLLVGSLNISRAWSGFSLKDEPGLSIVGMFNFGGMFLLMCCGGFSMSGNDAWNSAVFLIGGVISWTSFAALLGWFVDRFPDAFWDPEK